MLDVHGHGRGKRLGMCLVVELRASCVVSLQHVSMFEYAGYARVWTMEALWYVPCAGATYVVCHEFTACAYVLIGWLCMGMDEARASVRA